MLFRDHHAWCPYCQKIWLWLEEKKVPYRIQKVTMFCYGEKEKWYKKIVPLYIDNSAFQLSLKKGISKVERLNVLLRELFVLSVKYHCVFEPIWISTHSNVFADALSRAQWGRFFKAIGEVQKKTNFSTCWCGEQSPPFSDRVLRE